MVYLKEARTGAMFGLRAADGGAHHYYDVGIEHLAFEVDTAAEVDAACERCVGQEMIPDQPHLDRLQKFRSSCKAPLLIQSDRFN